MKLIAEKLAAHSKLDRLHFLREDGSRSDCPMPRQGILPHDLVHWVVETATHAYRGFLSLIAAGNEPHFEMQRANEALDRYTEVDAIRIEALVEGLQSQLWASEFDASAFAVAVHGACAARNVAPPDASTLTLGEALFARAQALNREWQALPPYGRLELEFPLDAH